MILESYISQQQLTVKKRRKISWRSFVVVAPTSAASARVYSGRSYYIFVPDLREWEKQQLRNGVMDKPGRGGLPVRRSVSIPLTDPNRPSLAANSPFQKPALHHIDLQVLIYTDKWHFWISLTLYI
jgi:hypothetical protein